MDNEASIDTRTELNRVINSAIAGKNMIRSRHGSKRLLERTEKSRQDPRKNANSHAAIQSNLAGLSRSLLDRE